MIAKCPTCSNHVQFEIADAGKQGICAYCKNPVQLIAVENPPLSKSTIACAYLLCFLMPFAGFFAGIYLLFKKQAGHGVCCIAISLVIGLLIFALFTMS